MTSNLLSSCPFDSATAPTTRARFGSALASIVLVVLFALVAQTLPGRAEVVIDVVLNQAKVVQLPAKTATVVIGNPIIADVTMLAHNSAMVLTAKGFGETNLIALDAQGNTLGQSTVRVSAANDDLIVQRGMERQTYSCTPRCEPTVALGDATKYMTDATSQISTRNGAAASGTAPAAQAR